MCLIFLLAFLVANSVFTNAADLSAGDTTSLASIVERLSALEHENRELKTRLSTLEETVETKAVEISTLKDANENLQHINQQTDKQNNKGKSNLITPTKETANDVHGKLFNRRAPSSHNNRIRQENEVNVAFFAALTNHVDNPGVHQPIVFDHVITNHGNGYNNHAGDFRAPVAGTYAFGVTLMAGTGSKPYHYSVMRNSAQVSRLYIPNGGTASQEVVLDLAQGDDVAIHHIDAGQRLYGHYYTSFSGFLLFQNYTMPAVIG